LIYVEDAGTQMRVRLLDEIGAEPETFFLRNASLPDSYDFSYNAEADRFLVELRNGMLITVDRSGTGLAEVSQFVQTGSRWMASWAADGEQVVYVRFDRGQYSLWISDIDSSGAGGAADMIYDTGSRPILYPVLNPRNPEHAVFGVFDESSGRTDLYSFFADAEEPEGPLHIQGRLVGTAWSPDGRFVAYAARTVAATTIYLYDSEEHDTEVLIEDTDADSRLAFSPDGRYLAFTSALGSAYLQIYAVPIEGGEAEQLTRLGAGARALVPLGWADVQVPDEPEPEEGQWQIR